MSRIESIHAREILDSRGFPTVEVEVRLDSGTMGGASVPCGASTGTYEAFEMRDKDSGRYRGRGVLDAVKNINEVIAPALKGIDPTEQALVDNTMIELDGTLHKIRFGANATLGVSLAAARAAANDLVIPLWRYLGGLNADLMPVPMMNVINDGVHADNNLNIQEFLIIPHGAPSFAESLRMGTETYHALKDILARTGKTTGTGDEGGFSCDFRDPDEVLETLMLAISEAGYQPGRDISIGLDVAASQFAVEGAYQFPGSNCRFTACELIDMYENLCAKYPVISIEDGLAEDDWQGWVSLTERLGKKIELIGDDLFVTHKDRLKIGIEKHAANSVLIKPNQIGTLTETLNVCEMALRAGYNRIIFHRSGETSDSFIADLSVATGAGQIKAGAPRGMERVRKYNRLIRIEEALAGRSEFAGKPSPRV
ncbi:MAG: phosphopyruvate hydratase [Cloacibacillus porcorum]|uniref:phosphopyruvate hydratase n=1 Tax=Cloacibacillus porcorum TaxID=1197717 RepID=UPI0023EFA549|nr:phosphopyruvate hydratase [Cloacibacillus porcorum]MCD7877169.1 phosphopyruvate hydratase [Cloacibacillus porcorum]